MVMDGDGDAAAAADDDDDDHHHDHDHDHDHNFDIFLKPIRNPNDCMVIVAWGRGNLISS